MTRWSGHAENDERLVMSDECGATSEERADVR
jgi:hypothetical protein